MRFDVRLPRFGHGQPSLGAHRRRLPASLRRVLIGLFMLLGLCGCTDGDDEALVDTVTVAELGVIAMTVTTPNTVVDSGISLKLTATGTKADLSTVDMSATVHWSSSNPVVATVSSIGEVATLAEGETVISANLGVLAASTVLMVSDAELTAVQLVPEAAQPAACRNVQINAEGTFDDGSIRSIIDAVTWVSRQPDIGDFATDRAGLLATFAEGTVLVSAEYNGLTAPDLPIDVIGRPINIWIDPVISTLVVGTSQTFTARADYALDAALDVSANASWSSEPATGIVQVDNTGQVTALATGQVTITATCAGVIGQASFVVEAQAQLVRIEINDGDPFLEMDNDETVQLSADALYADGSRVDITDDANWSVIDQGDEAVNVDDDDDKGLVAARLTTGIGVVEAEYESLRDDILIEVRRTD